MTAVLCDGCGRLSGPREVYCVACGRPLPGREVEPSEAAPPGWLVASERGLAAPVFEPLPAVPLAGPDPLAPQRSAWQPGWSVRESPAAVAARDREQPAVDEPAAPDPGTAPTEAALRGRRARVRVLPPPPVPLPLSAGAEDAAVAELPRPPLRVLYLPLLAVVLLSSTAAVVLLVLHVLRDR